LELHAAQISLTATFVPSNAINGCAYIALRLKCARRQFLTDWLQFRNHPVDWKHGCALFSMECRPQSIHLKGEPVAPRVNIRKYRRLGTTEIRSFFNITECAESVLVPIHGRKIASDCVILFSVLDADKLAGSALRIVFLFVNMSCR